MDMNGVMTEEDGGAPPSPGEAAILEEACWLADSGRYADFIDIENLLRFGYGLTNARALLDRYPVRRMLNRRCADARDERLVGQCSMRFCAHPMAEDA
ncbi:hypothetical protein [Paraburkholderia youngii]